MYSKDGGEEFPGNPVVENSRFVLPVERTWVQSLLGTKIPHAAMRQKEINK